MQSLVRLSFLLLLFMPFNTALAVDPTTSVDPATAALTAEVMKARIAEVEADSSLDEATRTQLTEKYNKTLKNLEKANFWSTTTKAYLKARKTAAAEARAIRDKLAQAKATDPIARLDVSESTPIAEVDQQLLIEKANEAAVETKLAKVEEQLANEAERPGAARQRLTEIAQLQ